MKTRVPVGAWVCLGLAALFARSSRVWADQVVIKGVSHAGASAVDFHDGMLTFRAADGSLKSAWIDEVDLILLDRVDRFEDFNEAERFVAHHNPREALIRYRRALRMADGPWADLIHARLFQACLRANDLDQAARAFVRILGGRWSSPATACRLLPESVTVDDERAVRRALDTLSSVVGQSVPAEQRVLARLFRYIMLRAKAALEAAADAGRKPEEGAKPAGWQHAAEIAAMEIPQAARCDQAYRIQISAFSILAAEGRMAEHLPSLERFLFDAPMALLPQALLMKGEALLATASSREALIRASWPFLCVAIHVPESPFAAEGLYGAATALERMGLGLKAIGLLEECVKHEKIPAETKAKAEALLNRLRKPEP